ncbi:hypothetical protein ANN_24033 [Periplaneta americana]|uniref:DUF4817 domain-containing protein n=1 Tax=Periplaneta americana TaxID=6978 RepID=A0ABQ8S1Y4_PERAM|nr:hypothetical protein ANN_24033 [Periplaneta americana]
MAGLCEDGNEPPGSLKAKYTDIVYDYGLCDGSSLRAVAEYERRFPNRRVPYRRLKQSFRAKMPWSTGADVTRRFVYFYGRHLQWSGNVSTSRPRHLSPEALFQLDTGRESLHAKIFTVINQVGLASVHIERIPNLTGEQSDGITVFRIPPMTSLMLHRCRTGTISLQRWWQSPSAAISESDWFLYRAGISRRITSCTVVSWRCILL